MGIALSGTAALGSRQATATSVQGSTADRGSASVSSLDLGLVPHVYGGERGSEPLTQATAHFRGIWGAAGPGPRADAWRVALHLDIETLGRRDLSFDLDEAWTRAGGFTFGRIHPWAVAGSPDARRPWGLLAQSQSQNRGIALGSPFTPEVFPQPAVMGWLGAHYLSAPGPVRVGLSATPLFVPSLGSEVVFSEDRAASAGRFGRRPPGYVRVEGERVPLRYRLDTTDLVREVLLRPQFMAQAAWGASSAAPGWMSVAYQPSPDPSSSPRGHLDVSTDVVGVAEVTPRFPYQVSASVTQEWRSLFASALWRRVPSEGDSRAGLELGLRGRAGELSLSQEERLAGDSAAGADASYADWLAQAATSVALPWRLEARSGVKYHLTQGGTWIRSALTRALGRASRVELGFDLFGGPDGSYFGEWRTNDRVFVSLQWSLEDVE